MREKNRKRKANALNKIFVNWILQGHVNYTTIDKPSGFFTRPVHDSGMVFPLCLDQRLAALNRLNRIKKTCTFSLVRFTCFYASTRGGTARPAGRAAF